ncbi:hypothetical protein [Jannaschia seohaensis]|uniref:Uncharacterized protein n=1 Tax=Jannaschia seohaensis TaxID=475081 RepID=A0A2Y9B3B8_9RHOB|nr:hypothetical protein [Jannaschia seohaensis]PWJ12460.1 hypothetical protein BCF38_11618 [Jannaschia seohaensis]SSA50941.1 hypothetical protein SAMN05421539_11618 [Jannaschia seohaensis]
MFGRYPNRRLTLRDVLRVRLQRALLLIPVYAALEVGGVLPDLRDFLRTHGPELAAQLSARSAVSDPSARPELLEGRRGCIRPVEGTAIRFQRPGDC